MTCGNRLVSDAPPVGSTIVSAPATTALPQSDVAMVRYDFDPQAQTISRTVIGVPSLTAIQQAPTGPNTVITGLVQDVSLRFWDPTQLTWRTDWDYEQQVQAAAAGTTGGATGATGSTSTTNSTTATTSGNNGDTTLPASVEVTITIFHPGDRTTAEYVATIPVVASQVVDGQTPPVNTTTTTGTGQ